VTRAGRKPHFDRQTAEVTGCKGDVLPDAASVARAADLLLVFGGDGTMLRVAREIAGSMTPILGINIGSLGFLTGVSSDSLGKALKQVWHGEFSFELRALLQATSDCPSVDQTALNDIVIGRGMSSRLVELDVTVDGNVLTRYRCDGLIVSSPTGSTAYSLAAGGAVVFPTAEVMAITPICPHTLSNRPMIIPLSSCVTVKIISPRPELILSTDGRVIAELPEGSLVTVRRSTRKIRLLHLAGSNFCETLRRKLHWRGTPLQTL
jgi:NAD+ kinase